MNSCPRKELFTLDENAVVYSPQNITVMNDTSTSLQIISPNHNHFTYMRGKTVLEAKRMIHSFTVALGFRQTVLFVDSCIAELYEDFMENEREYFNHDYTQCRFDNKYTDWIRPKLGLIAVAHEVRCDYAKCRYFLAKKREKLIFHFFLFQLMINIEESQRRDQGKTKKITKTKGRKIVKTFAKNVIPILLSNTLFQLPSTLELAEIFNHPNQETDDKPRSASDSSLTPTIPQISFIRTSDYKIKQISANALVKNAVIVSYILQVLGLLTVCLEKETINFLKVLLYPVLQKTSDCNHHYVQQIAYMVLRRISQSVLGEPHIYSLVTNNFDQLIETINSDLKFPGEYMTQSWFQQQISVQSLHKIVEFVSDENETNAKIQIENTNIYLRLTNITLLTNSCIDWFDKSFEIGNSHLLERKAIPKGLLRLFAAVTFYIQKYLTNETPLTNSNQQNETGLTLNEGNKWMILLLSLNQNDCLDQDSRDIFEDESPTVENVSDEVSQIILKSSSENTQGRNVLSMPMMSRIKSLLNRICFLSAFFLSSQCLHVQNYCCKVFKNSFYCLASIQRDLDVSHRFTFNLNMKHSMFYISNSLLPLPSLYKADF